MSVAGQTCQLWVAARGWRWAGLVRQPGARVAGVTHVRCPVAPLGRAAGVSGPGTVRVNRVPPAGVD